MALVMAQAVCPVWPKCGSPGTPGKANPMASNSGHASRTCWYTPGSSSRRWGSPAISGLPLAVAEPWTAHALLPDQTGASMLNRPTASGPSVLATCARKSLLGNVENRMCWTRKMPSGVHACHGVRRGTRFLELGPAAQPVCPVPG